MGKVRIIGGALRQRVIAFPEIAGLRPTQSRIREMLFNWLARNVQGARVLDLFAGSGALGFEAISRGAAQVHCVEVNPQARAALAQHAAHFELAPGVLHVHAQGFPKRLPPIAAGPYDLIFLDPPFQDDHRDLFAWLHREGLLHRDTLVYWEGPTEPCWEADSWEVVKIKRMKRYVALLYAAVI